MRVIMLTENLLPTSQEGELTMGPFSILASFIGGATWPYRLEFSYLAKTYPVPSHGARKRSLIN